MTDQTIPADKVREIIARWRDGVSDRGGLILDDLKALLPAPPRPTLADMTLDEQDECVGMQADLAHGDRVVILDGTPNQDGRVQVLESSLDVYRPVAALVTPRPDLPRMEWPGTGQDGEEATKVDYVSVAGGRTAYGPWTVARLRKKPAPAPAAPEPRIIRTFDELAALDPDTVLVDEYPVRMSAREWMEDYAIGAERIFPLAIIATGDQARAARQALEATDAAD